MLEIRAGTGGDEAALFAGDLFRMYSRYAEEQGWKIEPISASPSDVGGFKEIVAGVTGTGVFAKLKFESGVIAFNACQSRKAAVVSTPPPLLRSEEHTSELQSLMRISYAVFCLTKKNHT